MTHRNLRATIQIVCHVLGDLMAQPMKLDSRTPLEVWPDFPESEISSGTRASIGHRWVDDKATGLSVGVWEAEPNLGRWMRWPVHEFMIIVEGEVVTVEEDRETVIRAGETFFIPKGRRCIWNQAVYAKKFMVIFDDQSGSPDAADHPIVKIDRELRPSALLAAEISATPAQDGRDLFADATQQFTVGALRATAYQRHLRESQFHELMYVIDGTIVVTDETGGLQTFGQGDAFYVPIGMRTSWKSDGALSAVYCRFRPR